MIHFFLFRYAQALLERELSVLQLVDAMLSQTSEEYRKEADRAGHQLVKFKQELRETELELERADAEGPANHRRRDIVDKATKEAEHRERLLGLTQKIAGLEEKAEKEEHACVKGQEKMKVRHANRKECWGLDVCLISKLATLGASLILYFHIFSLLRVLFFFLTACAC